MDDFNSVINNSKLPEQLKEYFKRSFRIKECLNIDTLKDIEDIYIFYDSLYIFDSSEFSSNVVTSLIKCTNFDAFYLYLKKVIDSSLECKSKGNEDPVSHRFSMDKDNIDTTFVEVFNEFVEIIDSFYKHNLDKVNLVQTYKIIGKMELINSLIEDRHYNDLLVMGKKMLNQYIKCDS